MGWKIRSIAKGKGGKDFMKRKKRDFNNAWKGREYIKKVSQKNKKSEGKVGEERL